MGESPAPPVSFVVLETSFSAVSSGVSTMLWREVTATSAKTCVGIDGDTTANGCVFKRQQCICQEQKPWILHEQNRTWKDMGSLTNNIWEHNRLEPAETFTTDSRKNTAPIPDKEFALTSDPNQPWFYLTFCRIIASDVFPIFSLTHTPIFYLTMYQTYILTFCLTCILTVYLTHFAFCLTFSYSDIPSEILTFIYILV